MDLPNLTLFVQMGNFAVAYFILRKYVFVPAFNIILAQESRLDSLNQRIDTAYIQQQQVLIQQKSQRSFMKDSLKQMIPDFSKKLCQTEGSLLGAEAVHKVSMQDLKLSDKEKKEISVMLQGVLSDVKI